MPVKKLKNFLKGKIMSSLKKNWLYILIGILLLLNLVFESPKINACPLSSESYQDLLNRKIEGFLAYDLKNNSIDTRKFSGKSTLYIFFNPSNTYHKEILVYAQVLLNKYKRMGLEIIGVIEKDEEKALRLIEKSRFTFPVINDFKREIHNFFHIERCCGGVVLVGKGRMVKFISNSLLSPENIRQLVEKEVLGRINYEFKEPERRESFKINQLAPRILMRDIENGKVMDFWNFEDEYLIVSFFSNLCSICKSGRRIETLKELDRRLREKGVKAKIILVFSEPYDKEDIENWEKQIKMPFDKYISEDIFTDEEKYITDTSLKVDPLTVVLNRERKVVFVEELLTKEREILELIELKVK